MNSFSGLGSPFPQARKALTERQKDLEMKTQQLEIKLSNKTEEDIKKARRMSTQAGEPSSVLAIPAQREGTGLPVRPFPLPIFLLEVSPVPPPCPISKNLKERGRKQISSQGCLAHAVPSMAFGLVQMWVQR